MGICLFFRSHVGMMHEKMLSAAAFPVLLFRVKTTKKKSHAHKTTSFDHP